MTTSKASPKHYIGVDPSPNGTGIAILTFDNGVWQRRTLRISASKYRDAARLEFIYNNARRFLEDTIHSGYVVGACIESASLASPNQADKLGEVRGVLKLLLMRFTKPQEVPPTSLKKFATGNGGAQKDKVMSAMRKLGWQAQTDDEFDAAALAECARGLKDDSLPLTRKQLEALAGIKAMGTPKPKPPKSRGINI